MNRFRLVFLTLLLVASFSCGAPDRFRKVDEYGIIVYLDRDIGVRQHFQSHAILVSRFDRVDVAGEPSKDHASYGVRLIYPSLNKDGQSPLFSHEVRVRLPAGVPIDPMRLNPEEVLLVLEGREGMEYDLIGTVRGAGDRAGDAGAGGEADAWDFFANKPQYHIVD